MAGCTSPLRAPQPPTDGDAPRVAVVVDIEPSVVWADVPHRDELAGHVTGLLELGLADLVDVVPRVGGVVDVSLGEALTVGAERWRARAGVVASRDDALTFALMLCPDDPARRPPAEPEDTDGAPAAAPACWDFEAVGVREAPEAPMATLLGQAVNVLGRATAEGASRDWGRPQSDDEYAVLLAGRAAAVAYGLRPPVADADVGDERRDPLARAVFLDPGTSLGWWLVGRRAVARGEGWAAREAFARGLTARPASVALRADEAVALAAVDKWSVADARWTELAAVAPGDLRFAVPAARAALRAGRPEAAGATLDALPAAFQAERSVAELRVAIADAVGRDEDYDALLAAWEVAAPELAEPVRRRIALRVDERRYEDAYAFVPALEARGAADEAARLAAGLAVGLGRLDEAATHADRAGLADMAARIRARAALAAAPAEVPAAVDASADPIALLAAGEALLAGGHPADALARAERVLAVVPEQPQALDLRARAFDALGRPADAASTRARLRWSDPDYGA